MIRRLIADNKWLLLLLYFPVYLVAFFTIDKIEADHHVIVCVLDEAVRFNEFFVIPYALWFFWFPGVLLLFAAVALRPYFKRDPSGKEISDGVHARADFIKTCIVMFTSMTISLIIYVVWPNAVDLREPIERDNIFAKAVEMIRAADTPYGVCPSIHVATIIAEALSIKDSAISLLGRREKIAAYMITLLIAYSTMAIKQHSIIDVIAGALLAAVLYAVYRLIFHDKNTKIG